MAKSSERLQRPHCRSSSSRSERARRCNIGRNDGARLTRPSTTARHEINSPAGSQRTTRSILATVQLVSYNAQAMTTTPRTPGFLVDDPPPWSKPAPPGHSLLNNFELISDLARYAEGLFTRTQVKKKWRKLISDEMWDALEHDDALVDAIEAEKVRRIRDGSFKRERSQQLVTKAPDVLDSIMSDTKQSAKHRIDSAKALDQFAGNTPDAAEQPDRIIIRIDMGADVRARGGVVTQKDILMFEAEAPKLPPPKDDGGDGEPV